MVTGAIQLVGEARAEIDNVSVSQALALAEGGEAVFIDVRERAEHEAGAIAGAHSVPRGFLEFIADPASPTHDPALSSGRTLVVYCASGGRSALATRTLRDMGIANAVNLLGGFQAWSEAGGPTE